MISGHQGDELIVKNIFIYSVILLIGYPVGGYAEVLISEEDSNEFNISAQAQWESRYVTEGRDNLGGAGIQTAAVNIEYGLFGLYLWNGWGYDSEYDELNVVPSLNYEKNNINIYLSYNNKQFFEDDESDHEIGSGISYNGLPYDIFVGIDWYYSFEANGSFYEFSLGSEIRPVQKLSLEPNFIFGINDDYISDGHNGANHISLQLNGKYEITKQFNIIGYFGYNIAIDTEPGSFAGDEQLKDFSWGGTGIEVTF